MKQRRGGGQVVSHRALASIIIGEVGRRDWEGGQTYSLSCSSWTEWLFVWHLSWKWSSARHVRCWLTNSLSCLCRPSSHSSSQRRGWQTNESAGKTKRGRVSDKAEERKECIRFSHSCQETWSKLALLAFFIFRLSTRLTQCSGCQMLPWRSPVSLREEGFVLAVEIYCSFVLA